MYLLDKDSDSLAISRIQTPNPKGRISKKFIPARK
jgi:hypothetical protein